MVELSLEEEFQVALFEQQVDVLKPEEAKFLMKQMYRQMLIKDALWKNLAKSSWGMSDPVPSLGNINKDNRTGDQSC